MNLKNDKYFIFNHKKTGKKDGQSYRGIVGSFKRSNFVHAFLNCYIISFSVNSLPVRSCNLCNDSCHFQSNQEKRSRKTGEKVISNVLALLDSGQNSNFRSGIRWLSNKALFIWFWTYRIVASRSTSRLVTPHVTN